MLKQTVALVLFASFPLVACAKLFDPGVHTPASIKGDIPVTVVNSQKEQVICAATLAPDMSTAENILGADPRFKPGETAKFSVRAGTYMFRTADCDAKEGKASMSGTIGENNALPINGPTLISIGGPPASTPPGVQVVVIEMAGTTRDVCNAAGSDCRFDNGRSCCPGTSCIDNVCREQQ